MSEWAERFRARVVERLEAEARAIGEDMVDDIRESINTPVEYLEDRTVRSLPGEPPRREFGLLWERTHHDVEKRGDVVELTVANDAPYARRLEEGDEGVRPRPFFGPARERWFPRVRERIRAAIVRK